MPADRLVVLPDGISDRQGAAIMLKGMTTQYLIRQIHKVSKGDVILFHAAAGGVGLIACQWAKALGATVIGTVGSDEKAELCSAQPSTRSRLSPLSKSAASTSTFWTWAATSRATACPSCS